MDTRNSEKIFSYLQKIHNRFEDISRELTSVETIHQQKKYRELGRELFSLKALEEKYHQFQKLLDRIAEADILLKTAEDQE
jgi:protein subunit release factor A